MLISQLILIVEIVVENNFSHLEFRGEFFVPFCYGIFKRSLEPMMKGFFFSDNRMQTNSP